jgi:hypothetical protein
MILPLVPITLKLSPSNVAIIKATALKTGVPRVSRTLEFVWTQHLTPPVLVLSILSICVSIFKRDKRLTIFLLWIVSFYVASAYAGPRDARYVIYWIPPFCLFACTATNFFDKQFWRVFSSILLLIIAGYQFAIAFQSEPAYADVHGYEKAAKYVVENRKGESVLFSGMVDSGYFVFFVRKHDPNQELIVLRADKLLVTSRLRRIVEQRITSRTQIYDILRDKEVGSPPLNWLREELRSERFELRKMIPVGSNNPRLRDLSLAIYEYKGYVGPRGGKILNMSIPLMDDAITVKLDDLLHKE